MTNIFSKPVLPAGFCPRSDVDYESASSLPLEIVGEVDHCEMVLIPAGEFLMGTSEEQVEHMLRVFAAHTVSIALAERPELDMIHLGSALNREYFSDEMPQHSVWLDAFYIDKYEVTNEVYAKFCAATGHKVPQQWEGGRFPEGTAREPVYYVSWYDACTYAKWAGKRLPTEAEWEKAARGIDGRWFPWGTRFERHKVNYGPPHDLHDLHNKIVLGLEYGRAPTDDVDAYPEGASPYGVMDMLGNVAEWVYDWHDPTYYSRSPHHNPKGPEEGTRRVHKGCGLSQERRNLHCANRMCGHPSDVYGEVGFRCALSLFGSEEGRGDL